MEIPPEIMNLLRLAAPTLGLALGGPLGGAAATVAVSALSKYLSPKIVNSPMSARPDEIITAITSNLDDPELVSHLKNAEDATRQYERDLGFKFADLEAKERENIREFQTSTGLASEVFKFGRGVVYAGYAALITMALSIVALMFGLVSLPTENTAIITVGFSIISSIITGFSAWAVMVLSFYYGRSADSDAKSNALQSALQTSGAQLGEAAATASKAAAVAAEKLPSPQVVVVPPTAGIAPAVSVAADWQRGPFGGVRWQLLPEGVLVEGETTPGRTVGEPITVRRIWRDFGGMIEASCARNGVPAELVVACIATESRGVINATLKEPDGRQSVGLMQTLIGTASEVMGREITYAELITPEVSIEAGTRYLKRQYDKTKFQPPLAAAAYNAGGLYQARDQDNNRWNLRSTGDHIDKFCLYFNDSVFVAKQDKWSQPQSSQSS